MKLRSFDNHILIADLALTEENCKALINDGLFFLNNPNQYTHTSNSKDRKVLARQDTQVYIPYVLHEWWDTIQKAVFDGLDMYSSKHEICRGLSLESRIVKFQKTEVGQVGFSDWHVEQCNGEGISDRCLAWMIYLNDVTDGGETEFCDQRVKVSPTTGTLVMWPSGITHPHRGNPPYSNDKYIITGWLNLSREIT